MIIIAGLIVSVIAMETVPVNNFQLSDEKSQADNQQDKDETMVATQSVIALPLSLEFHIDPELFLLNIIPENETKDTPNTLFSDILSSQQKVLKVLFRRIISPNAP